MLTLPPLSLYIHIPWCVRKCPYCDFNSHAVRDTLPETEYVQALLNDLEHELPAAQGRMIESVFIGGGTPSLFSATSIETLLREVQQRVPFRADAEITMEANPGTFEQAKFAGFLAAGVNRLSVGVQSFNSEHLHALGRIHTADEAYRAIAAAREIGFKRLNIDLMHGLPGQSATQALDDLNTAIALQPDHLSWYQLTIEPNTEFHAKPPRIPEDETLWDIQTAGQQRLREAGFQQYEISAYATSPSARAAHNLNYWQFGDYIGIGAGAHGKLTFQESDTLLRRWKQRSPKAYMQSVTHVGGEQTISRDERPFEFMMNALRLLEGVDECLFMERTGLPLESINKKLTLLRNKGLMAPSPRLAPSSKGTQFLNDLLEFFLD